MRRFVLPALLLGHALAQSLPGMRSADGAAAWKRGDATLIVEALRWSSTVLWAIAAVGLAGAAFAVLGARGFRGGWRPWATTGAISSILLLALYWDHRLAIPGLLVNTAVLLAAWPAPPAAPAAATRERTRGHRLRDAAALAAVVLLGATIVLRPWHMRWGSTESELRAVLPGDDPAIDPVYQIQHAVTVRAPAAAVWPWLVQVGQDRGGFYSYAWLENLFGLHIRNADRINPQWQTLVAGDSVFATFPGWLGIRRRLGWRVARVEPNRVLHLEPWGAFVLEPMDSVTTRLIVRTRGAATDGIPSLVLAPVNVLMFEPAHFIMERRMLLTLKARAEGMRAPRARAVVGIALLPLLVSGGRDRPEDPAQVRAPHPADSVATLSITMNLPAYRLEVYDSGRRVRRHGVAIGTAEYPTPVGDFAISRLELNPSRTPPPSPWATGRTSMPPGGSNPVGRAKLRLLPLYYIHGTPDSGSVGLAASHGCIRMANHDVVDLAALALAAGAPGLSDTARARMLADPVGTHRVDLPRAIGVTVRYELLEIIDGRVHAYPDVYRRRSLEAERTAQLLLERAVAPRAVAAGLAGRLLDEARRGATSVPLDSIGST